MLKDLALLFGSTRAAAGTSEREVKEHCPGRLERKKVAVEGADGRRRKAPGFDSASEHAGRDMALGTKGKDEHEVDAHRGEVCDDGRRDLERELFVTRDRTDHGDGGRGNSANRADFLQFEKTFDGIGDVGIGFWEDSDRRSVCNQQILAWTLTRDSRR